MYMDAAYAEKIKHVTTVSIMLQTKPPREVAESLGLDYDEREAAVVLPGWEADDGNARVAFPEAKSAKEAARRYVDGGDWSEREPGAWVDINVWRQAIAFHHAECSYCRDAATSYDHQGDPACPMHRDEGAGAYVPITVVIPVYGTTLRIPLDPPGEDAGQRGGSL